MHRLRYGDWICGSAALALLVLPIAGVDGGWGDRGRLTSILTALAIAAGLATVALTATRESPSAPLLALVASVPAGLGAAIALLAGGAPLQMAAALVLVAGALAGMRDERSPGAPEITVDRRPAPPA